MNRILSAKELINSITMQNFKIISNLTDWAEKCPYTELNLEQDFQSIRLSCDELLKTMPAIGVFSVAKRVDCFLWVCKQLDYFIKDERITLGGSLSSLFILMLESKSFFKAWTMIDIRKSRYIQNDSIRASLPKVASIALQGINL